MRSRLAALMLMSVVLLLSAMNLPAAPVPDPSAVLDIGPPPKDTAADKHCKQAISGLTHPRGGLWDIKNDADVKKLPSFARLKGEEIDPWLTKNLRIKEEKGGRHLHLTFRAGNHDEQVVILNALLVGYTGDSLKQTIKRHEDVLQLLEKSVSQYVKAGKDARDPNERARWQKKEAGAKATMARIQAEVDRLKQIAVIKWAK